ncbi:hypothetical protein C6P46_005323 [Rhodotorula mucilaginosa]|uniref:Uncharacterized protein n=1 Tax=Rhodotorula mucilaginosa TaxID=5537 RepID=A0A9P6W0W2_RHOMI|nr:hypothetical protein C6P46_005323 [Rhodotorula mucilaginosa]
MHKLKERLSSRTDEPPQQPDKPFQAVVNKVDHQQQAASAHAPPLQAPIELHVYKEGALYGKDDIITGADKQQMQYYLHFPLKFFSGRWELSLRRGGPQGPEICQILKGGSWSNSFELHWTSTGAVTPVQQMGTFRLRYEFPASQETYCWKSDSWLSSGYQFSLYKSSEVDLPEGQRTTIARWSTSIGFTKDGTLQVNPAFSYELELILATALGLEERSRERRERRR